MRKLKWERIRYSLLDPSRRKVLLSVGFNLATRIPALVPIIVLLPLFKRDLGSAEYGRLLAELALGASLSIPFTGISTVARRLVGKAFALGDSVGEAAAFVSASTVTLIASILVLVVSVALNWTVPGPEKWKYVAIIYLPVIAAALNVINDISTAYGEPYIPAGALMIFQIVIAVFAVWLFPLKFSFLYASVILQAPYILSGLSTLVILSAKRPYLYGGPPRLFGEFLRNAPLVAAADGGIGAVVNVSIYWVALAGGTVVAGWFGTMIRLFQALYNPLIYIIIPLSSYLAIMWWKVDVERRDRIMLIVKGGGVL